MSNDSTRPVDLWIARVLTLGPVVLAFPVATAAVFWCTIGWMAGTLWNHFEEKGES